MGNDKLRQALQQAGLTGEDLAQIVEVDSRTVRRWLTGRTPYPKQRGRVARALDTTEHQLWPETTIERQPGQPSDLMAGYAAASDLTAPDWKRLMREASDEIDLLGDLLPILDTPGVPEVLIAKAAHGCEIRILIADPMNSIEQFIDQPGIEIRVPTARPPHTIHRFDQQLQLILHLGNGDDIEHAPLFHLRRAAPKGLFDRLIEHYNQVWEHDSGPLDPDPDLARRGDPELDLPAPAPEPPAARAIEPLSTRPRRWPRKTT